jgi:hypothetical protein
LLAILKDNCLIIPLKYCRLGKGWEPEGVEAAGLIRGSFLKVQLIIKIYKINVVRIKYNGVVDTLKISQK